MTTLGIINTVLIAGAVVCLTFMTFRLTVSAVQEFLVVRQPEHSRTGRNA